MGQGLNPLHLHIDYILPPKNPHNFKPAVNKAVINGIRVMLESW